jgi:imidazolonepropionase-like amidohydrolase
LGLRDAISRGEIDGPNIQDSIDIISATGGHGDLFGYREAVRDAIRPPALCDGADDCRRVVRDLVRRGADVIKVAATGGVLSATNTGKGLQMEPDELRAIVQTAHRLHRKVAAHAHAAEGVNAALEAGVDSVEHGTFLDDHSLELFKKTGAYLVPTLETAFVMKERARSDPTLPEPVREKARGQADARMASVRKARLAGVRMAFGTDASNIPHGENAREFLRLREAGFSAEEAIRMATVNAADLLDLTDQVGSIVAGKRADIIATAGDPLEDIGVLRDVRFVMSRGRVVKDCFRAPAPDRGPDEGCK